MVTTLAEGQGKRIDALLSCYYVPSALHTLSQLPEIIFAVKLVYKKNSEIIHYLIYS